MSESGRRIYRRELALSLSLPLSMVQPHKHQLEKRERERERERKERWPPPPTVSCPGQGCRTKSWDVEDTDVYNRLKILFLTKVDHSNY